MRPSNFVSFRFFPTKGGAMETIEREVGYVPGKGDTVVLADGSFRTVESVTYWMRDDERRDSVSVMLGAYQRPEEE